MIPSRKHPMPIDRRKLANEAMVASISARQRAGFDLHSPICIYRLADCHGVGVRFHAIPSMEGMYQRGKKCRIHLSALRPVARKAFTCGHELGHHIFGHGSTIDELREEGERSPTDQSNEFVADTFAAFALIPTLGLRHAFAARKLTPSNATPRQLYLVSCEFGVGYTTLITHLAYTLREIRLPQATMLLRSTPKVIRAEILGATTAEPLIVTDECTTAVTLDAEVGTRILVPADTRVDGNCISHAGRIGAADIYQAKSPGIARVERLGTDWAKFIRVSKHQYVGLAQYRHLEDSDSD